MTEPQFEPQFHQINYNMARFIEARYNPEAPVKERFITWWELFTTHANSNPFDVVYMDQIATSHLYPYIGKQPSAAYYSESRAILKEGQDNGLIKNVDISLINQFVRAAVTCIIKTNISIGKSLTKDEIESVIKICWDGIKKD